MTTRLEAGNDSALKIDTRVRLARARDVPGRSLTRAHRQPREHRSVAR